MQRYPKSQVLALDFAEPMLARTKKRGGWWRKPVCLCGDLESLPLADDSYDAAYCSMVLHHVARPEQALRESEEHPFLGREIAQPRRFSESSATAVDDAVRDLILEAEKRAGDLLESNRKPLGELVRLLEKEETLHREQIEGCLGRVPGKENIREIGVAKESG